MWHRGNKKTRDRAHACKPSSHWRRHALDVAPPTGRHAHISMTVDIQSKLFISATVKDSNFKFGTHLGLGQWLDDKQLLRPKLAGVRARGVSKKFGTACLFLQRLKLASSNLVYNLCLGSSLPRNNLYDQNWRGVRARGEVKNLEPPHFFLQPLKLATSNLVHNFGLGVRYNSNFSTELGRGWLRYRST